MLKTEVIKNEFICFNYNITNEDNLLKARKVRLIN